MGLTSLLALAWKFMLSISSSGPKHLLITIRFTSWRTPLWYRFSTATKWVHSIWDPRGSERTLWIHRIARDPLLPQRLCRLCFCPWCLPSCNRDMQQREHLQVPQVFLDYTVSIWLNWFDPLVLLANRLNINDNNRSLILRPKTLKSHHKIYLPFPIGKPPLSWMPRTWLVPSLKFKHTPSGSTPITFVCGET